MGLARVGVVLRVDNLKVEQRGSHTCFVARHTVESRARIVCFQNPTGLSSGSEYLRCTVELVDAGHSRGAISEQPCDPVVVDRLLALRACFSEADLRDVAPPHVGANFWEVCTAW